MSISPQLERRSAISVVKLARKSSMNHQKNLLKIRRRKDGEGKPWWDGY
jgi:hypothetical protein